MKVETKCGFSCEINENIVNDWNFTKALAKCDSGNELDAITGVTSIVTILFGKKGEAELMEILKNEDGIVPSDKIIEVTKEVLGQLKDEQAKK